MIDYLFLLVRTCDGPYIYFQFYIFIIPSFFLDKCCWRVGLHGIGIGVGIG